MTSEDSATEIIFEILPPAVYQSSEPRFAEMPVELIARILRYLDAESLLNLVRTYQFCKNVCLGDPLLRRRLRTVLKETKKLEMERRINPSLGVTVTRTEPGKMFGRNTKKTVTTRVLSRPKCLADVEEEFYRCTKRKNEGNVKIPRNIKCHYRL